MRRRPIQTRGGFRPALLLTAGFLVGCENVEPADYVARLSQCLRTGGADVEAINPVTLSIEPGPGMSNDELERLQEDCQAQAGPPPERRLDRATASRVYKAYLDIRTCLVEEGYEPRGAPSEETFIEQFAAGGGWHPYDRIEAQFASAAEQARVEAACPQWVE